MNKLKFAIIGFGRIGQRHAEHIKRLAVLSAVCDIKEHLAPNVFSKYGCNFYNAIDEMLLKEKDLDVVSICTPNGLHAEHTIKSLRAGKHVLCEKPMATKTDDCKLMIDEAEKAQKELFIVKQNRFNPPIIEVKKIIDERRLGRILNIQLNCFWNRNDDYYLNSDWKGKKHLDGGILFTQFSHFIDLLYWFNGDVENVHVFAKNLIHQCTIEFEDTAVVAVEFANGALGTLNFTINSYRKNMEGSITIFGEKGTIKVGGQYLNVLEYHCIDGYEIIDLPISRPPNDYGLYQGSMSNHDKVYENIIDVLLHQGKVATNGYEGMKTVEIIEKIYANVKSL